MGETITISKDTLYGIIIAILAGLLVLSVMTSGFGIVKPATNTTCPTCSNTTVQNNTNTSLSTMELPANLASAPVLGPQGSAVRVLEFSDFQCPFCGMVWGSEWSQQYASDSRYGPIVGTIARLETNYVDTGKAAFVHFPVAFLGQESVDAANAAFCAGDQGKYFEMHDLIFSYNTMDENTGKYAPEKLKDMARNITGLNLLEFDSCVDASTHAAEVNEFTNEWNSVSYANTGRAGTPTFYILVDSSKVSKDKVMSAVGTTGYTVGPSKDGKYYVIIADPVYSSLAKVINGLLA